MFKAIQTSVSGLVAATDRANVAASNIANALVKSTPPKKGSVPSGLVFSAGYTPQRVEQSTTSSGGVRTTIVPVSPASLSVFDPTSPLANEQGNVNIPNVSLPAEIAELIRAKHAYKANAKVIMSLNDTYEILLKT